MLLTHSSAPINIVTYIWAHSERYDSVAAIGWPQAKSYKTKGS